MDEAILLPAVLIGIYRSLEARRSWIPVAVIAAAALIELFAGLSITAWYYTWTTPAWLAVVSSRDRETQRTADA